jgi:hypothetical protein
VVINKKRANCLPDRKKNSTPEVCDVQSQGTALTQKENILLQASLSCYINQTDHNLPCLNLNSIVGCVHKASIFLYQIAVKITLTAYVKHEVERSQLNSSTFGSQNEANS